MMNSKVKNATKTEFNGIKFKSLLECYCYKKALELGLEITYEPQKFTLVDGFTPQNLQILSPVKEDRHYRLYWYINKIRAVTYSPDFIVCHNNSVYVIETKGKPNDTYPLKKKMFLKLLDEVAKKMKQKIVFMEPHNKTQVDECLNLITNETENYKRFFKKPNKRITDS